MDIDFLIDLLEKFNPSAQPPSTDTLDKVFTELEKVRIPYSAELVRRSRAQGEEHVASAVEVCIARNNGVRALCKDPKGYEKRFGL